MSSEQQDKLKQFGNSLFQKQEYEGAAKFYDRALELDSTSEAAAAIFSNRSLCNLNTKKYTEALQDAEKAISLRPTWHRGYQRAAAAYEKLEKHEDGLKYLEKSFELDEASKTDSVFKKMKEDFEINNIKQKASSMTQDELKQAGNNFIKNQQYQQAIDLYTLAIEKNAFCDEAVPILSNRSMAYFKIGKYKEAYEDGGFCCGIKPDWAKGFMRRGVAAEKLGEWQIALESYDEYLKLDPQDEAGVQSSRNAVAKVVADQKREEEARQKELQRITLDLESTSDFDERRVKSYQLFMNAGILFDIERLKIALKQPCNIKLDTPYFLNQESSSDPVFYPAALESARKIFERSPGSQKIITPFAEMISMLDDEKMKLKKIPISRQVEFLDFILDVAEEQNFSAYNVGLRRFLIGICKYELSASSKQTVIRKDLVITLFNRIDIARKAFYGEKASNKDFASDVLFTMCFNYNQQHPSRGGDVSSDICTQDLYECICTAIASGADPNIKAVSGRSTTSLESAIHSLRSVKVVELLLRHGAEPNTFSFIEASVAMGRKSGADSSVTTNGNPISPLIMAFQTYRPDIIRALLRYGAKIPTEKVPTTVLKYLPPSKYPLVKAEAPAYLFVASLAIMRKPHLRPYINEEYIQLWFEVMATQNLSFVCPSPCESGCITPLYTAIDNCLDAKNVIALMIRLKPELLRQIYLPYLDDQQPPPGVTPLGKLFGAALSPNSELAYLQSVAKVLMDSGIDITEDIAQCCFEGDEVESVYTGEEYVDELGLQVNDKLRTIKNSMMPKK